MVVISNYRIFVANQGHLGTCLKLPGGWGTGEGHSFFRPSKGRAKRKGSRGGTVVRALASHQCGAGFDPRLGVMCGLSLLVRLHREVSPLLKNQNLI